MKNRSAGDAARVHGHFLPSFTGIPRSQGGDAVIRALADPNNVLGVSWDDCPIKVAVNALLGKDADAFELAPSTLGWKTRRIERFTQAWDSAEQATRDLFKAQILKVAQKRGLTADDDAFLAKVERGEGAAVEELVPVRA